VSLPPDLAPKTWEAVDILFSGDPEQRFEFGLDVIIRGIETFARGDQSHPEVKR
jgi:hypothetical protein